MGAASPLPAPGKTAVVLRRKRHVSCSYGLLDTGKIDGGGPLSGVQPRGWCSDSKSVSHETPTGAEVQERSWFPTRHLLKAAAGSVLRGGHNSRDAGSSAPLPHAWLTRLLHEGPRTPGNIGDGNRSTDVLPCRGGGVWGRCFTGNTRHGCVANRNRTRGHATRRGRTRQMSSSSKGMAAPNTDGGTDHAASVFHVKHWPRLQLAVRPLARNGNKGALHRCRRPESRRRLYAESAMSRADTVCWTLARLMAAPAERCPAPGRVQRPEECFT